MKRAESAPHVSSTTATQQPLLDPGNIGQPGAAQSAPTRLPDSVRDFGYLPDFSLWRPGDVLLFSAVRPGFMQRRIIATQRRENYAPVHARWHHAGVYLGDRYVCEAVPGGVRYRPVEEFVSDYLIRVRRDDKLEIDQAFHVAIRAMMRLSRPYAHWPAVRAWLRSWSRGTLSLDYRVRRRAIICSQLFHDAYMEATSRTLVERVDIIVFPAELSACNDLSDVRSAWVPIP